MFTAPAISTCSLFDRLENTNFLEPVRSPLNYIGGKYNLLPQLLRFFPDNIGCFVDLFCGGCNVGANIAANRIIFNDNLTYLIDLYHFLKTHDLQEILDHIYVRIAELNLSITNTDGYIALRNLYNEKKHPLDLFVLIAFSFNHQIRFNSSHKFNNPFGKNRSCFNPKMEQNLIRFVNRIHNINCEFYSQNFNDFNFDALGSNDFVYCDPPYLITTGTYNDGKRGFTGWSEKEELELLCLLDNLTSKNIKFALSNVLTHKGQSNSLLIDWIKANGYRVEHLSKSYANSNFHTSDRRPDASDEVLIMNFH